MSRRPSLLDEFGLERCRSDAIDLAVDVVIAVGNADVLHFRAAFERVTVKLQVVDYDDYVTTLERVAVGVARVLQ